MKSDPIIAITREKMQNYIDGFVLPIPRKDLATYQNVAKEVAKVWKEYGALDYQEHVGDAKLDGVRNFPEAAGAKEDEVVIFGWVVFPSKEIRDDANAKVPNDPRMADIVAPLVDPDNLIFDASRMIYGGFKPIV